VTTLPPGPKRTSHSYEPRRVVGNRQLITTAGDEPVAMKPDWILVALPTALSMKTLYTGASETIQWLVIGIFAVINGSLVAYAFLRRVDTRFATQSGPMLIICSSSAIVLTRPAGIQNVLVFLLVAFLAVRLARTVDSRSLIGSLVDGVGVYLLANVVAYAVGMRSPSTGVRLATEGRIIFPLAQSINLPPVLAAVFITSCYFLVREPGIRRRILRAVFLASAIFVLVGSAARVASAIAALLVFTAIVLPNSVRVVAQISILFSLLSALILPKVIALAEFAIAPVTKAIRSDSYSSVSALNGRDYIWEKSVGFWRDEVSAVFNILFGYGLQGHYNSGASRTYYDLWNRSGGFDPLKSGTTHNSFLQQLFDGGLVGCGLLLFALLWTCKRLSDRLAILGQQGLAALMLLSTLALAATTEVLLSPNASLITFWVLVLLVGAACQDGVVSSRPARGSEPAAGSVAQFSRGRRPA